METLMKILNVLTRERCFPCKRNVNYNVVITGIEKKKVGISFSEVNRLLAQLEK